MNRTRHCGAAGRIGCAVLAGALAVAGCGADGPTSTAGLSLTTTTIITTTTAAPSSTTALPRDPYLSTVAEAVVPVVDVYADASSTGTVTHQLPHPTPTSAPLTFLVVGQKELWLRVLLPVRPNGSTGWIHANEVTLFTHRFRIVVSLSELQITVTDGPDIILQEPIGIGTVDTPTPGGAYYIKELLQPPDPDGPYGPYAYGLSGFSTVLTNFAGGDGVIGIHGTNDPTAIGRRVSHGCIRMSNDGITQLAAILPLGVPVLISD